MKIWFKEWKNSHLIRDVVIEDNSSETRTHKVFNALDDACHELDLSRPIWLDVTVRDFQKRAKARFMKDQFVDSVPFDYLEIEVIEEDERY